MIQEIEKLMSDYHKWLKDRTSLRAIEKCVEITTPYLDRHNDYVQIYACRDEEGIFLTDDGFTIDDLIHSGCKLDSPKRQNLLKLTLNGFGVKLLNDNTLIVHTSPDNFSLKKHSLVQAILAVNDLFYLSGPVVASLFYEDVVHWLDQNDIRYTPQVKFSGKSGYDHNFDFVIPKSKKSPERILHTISSPNRDKAQSVAFAWLDTKEVRKPDSQAFALLNDSDIKISSNVIDALQNYDVIPVLWSKRSLVLDKLAA